jgi:hypothetical protein
MCPALRARDSETATSSTGMDNRASAAHVPPDMHVVSLEAGDVLPPLQRLNGGLGDGFECKSLSTAAFGPGAAIASFVARQRVPKCQVWRLIID